MKRFTETEKWRDPWFQKLDRESRTLWVWLCDRVDNAGVIDICWPICNAETGGTYSEESLKALEDKVEKLSNGKWWLPGFVNFQVGKLSDHCKPHIYIINLLNKHNLYHRVLHRVSHTIKEKEQEKEQEQEKETASIKVSIEPKTSEAFNIFWEIYPRTVAKEKCKRLWRDLNMDKLESERVLGILRAQMKSESWTKENGKYVPSSKTWLEEQRWNDDLKPKTVKKYKSFDEYQGSEVIK